MAAFVVRRLLWTIPILWVVVTIVFFMMRSIGGDPFRRGPMLGLSNVGWVKYGDYQPPSIRRNQRGGWRRSTSGPRSHTGTYG